MSRTKNSIKNIIFAFGVQAIITITSFVTRTVLIKYLGMQAQSLNGLFTEVISALSLAEMGVGTAIIYNLYKPLADKDMDKVSQLMELFKKAYRVIALTTLLLGAAICPWINLIVNSLDYSRTYIQIIYMLFVIQLSISYLFSYKTSLLIADQKNYIQSQVTIITKIVITLLKIATIILTRNFLVFMIVSIVLTIINNIISSYIVDRQYPWLGKTKVAPLPTDERKQVFSNIKNLFIKSLSGKITNSTDNILISLLVSTIQVGYYSSYALIFSVFKQISNQIAYSGVSASLGNLLISEDNEHCVTVFYRLSYIFYMLASVSTVCIFVCVEPFVTIWLGKEYLLGMEIVLICCLNLFIEIMTRPLWAIMEVSGLFKYDKYVSIVGSVVNIIVSIAFGLKIGMLGIFIGTFLTYFIQMLLKALLLFKKRLDYPVTRYYKTISIMFTGMLLQLAITYLLCNKIHLNNVFIEFILFGLIGAVITISTNILFTFKTDSFHYFYNMLKSSILKK